MLKRKVLDPLLRSWSGGDRSEVGSDGDSVVEKDRFATNFARAAFEHDPSPEFLQRSLENSRDARGLPRDESTLGFDER